MFSEFCRSLIVKQMRASCKGDLRKCKKHGEQGFMVSIQSTMECFSNTLRMGVSA